MTFHRALCALALAAAGVSPAFADDPRYDAALQCVGDVAAVRFGGSYYPAPTVLLPLPQPRDAQWKDAPLAKDGRCILSGGAKVVLRSGYESPEGNSASSSPVFSLWVDGRKLALREVFYGDNIYLPEKNRTTLNSLFVSPGKIERCAYPRDQRVTVEEPHVETVTCDTQALDLAAISVDLMEPAGARAAFSIASLYNEAFCRRVIRKWGDINPAASVRDRAEEVIGLPVGAATPFPRDGNRDVYGSGIQTATLDFWNDGEPVTAIRVWFENRWSEAQDTLLIAYLSYGNTEDAVRGAQAAIGSDNRDFYAGALAVNGWSAPLPAGQYDAWRLFQLNGVTYAMGVDGRQGAPLATLYRPQVDAFGDRTMEPVCVFQQGRVNF